MMNIAGLSSIEDANYRYKMPRLLAKVEGRGNGIKTVIVNMKEVAQALHRQTPEVTKFFGTELGAQTTYREETERAVVNGAHTAQALQQLLCKYIQAFVLCPSCQLPETGYKIKGGVIYQKCDACGEKSMVDMSHKLTTFIINTHKKASKDDKAAKEKKKKDRAEKEKAGAEEEDGVEGAGGEEKEKKKKKKKDKDKDKDKKKSKKKDKKKEAGGGSSDGEAEGSTGKKSGSSEDGEEEDEDGEMVATMDNLSVEDASALAAAVDRLQQFLVTNPDAPAAQVLDEVRMISTFSALPVEDRLFLFVQAAFGPECAKQNLVAKHKAVLRGLILSVDAEAYQRRLIGVTEHLCAVTHPDLMKWFPLLLKQLYDEDLVDEDVFLEWAEEEGPTEFTRRGVSAEMVEALRAEAAKFVTWLKEADESGSDSEEEEEASSSSEEEEED